MSRSFILCAVLALFLAGCGGSSGSSSGKAATVNGHVVSMNAYKIQLTLLEKQSESTAQAINPCNGSKSLAPFCDQLKKTALTGVINNEIVREYAATHHISISQADFQRQWTVIVNGKFHGNEQVVRAYVKTLGINEDQLKQIDRQQMLQDRVMYDVTKNLSMNAPSVRLSVIQVPSTKALHQVQRELKHQTPFNELAAALSTDPKGLCRGGQCGDRGWFPTELVPQQESSIATTHVGHVAGPFTGQSGYSLVFVEAYDPHHKLKSTQQLAIRQQRFAQWLAVQAQRADVRKYVAT